MILVVLLLLLFIYIHLMYPFMKGNALNFLLGGEESCIKYYSNIVIYMLCLYYYYDYCIRCAGHVVYY